ncbi:hypothetical protein [Pseudoalteromonas piscicida]
MLVDDAGNEVTELAPGESANLTFSDNDFMILSSNGAVPVIVSPSEESAKAPIITTDQSFSVEENTAVDTVIGQLEVEYASDFANPVSEFIVIASTSSAITVNSSGQVIVANSEQLDFDSGLESVELEVVATDTGGNVSEPAKIMVEVTNLMDEESEQPTPNPTPTPTPSKSSSGSLFWLLLAAPLALLRRRK